MTTEDLHAAVRLAWTQALGHDGFTDDDFFFSIGGTSLSALKVTAVLKQALGRPVPVRLLFAHQTVAAFTSALAGAA